MGKMKLYELAKELNLTSKELLDKAKKLGIEAKSHLSGLEENEIAKLKNEFMKNPADKKEARQKEAKKVKNDSSYDKKLKEKPVIIRREVIFEDEEEKQEETKEKEQKTKEENVKKEVKETKKEANQEIKKEMKSEVNQEIKKEQRSEENQIIKKEIKPEVKQEIKKEIKSEVKQEVKMEQKSIESKSDMKVEMKKDVEIKKEQEVKKEVAQSQKFENKHDTKFQNNKSQEGYQGKNNNKNFKNDRGFKNNSDNDRNYKNNYDNERRQNGSRDYSQNSYKRNDFENRNDYRNKDTRFNNSEKPNYKDRNNSNMNTGRFGDRNNRQNGSTNGYGQNNSKFNKRPLDNKGIEKNIKDIMSIETGEKEIVREYNKSIDKKKENNKFDENRNNKKKTRRNQNDYEINEGKLKNLKQQDRLSNMFDDQDNSMLDYYDLSNNRGRKGKKKNAKDEEQKSKQKIFKLTEITIPESITVKDLSLELKKTSGEVIMKLMSLGIMATLNNDLDFDTAFLVASEFGVTANKKVEVKEEDILFDESEDKEDELVTRPPVVVVMGHVDHGKTSLLDVIRKTNVIEGEAGGITQAIGAYKVKVNDREITFLDTPGHEAFTAMRARGAQITDIAILVVAANDGVMPQTVEAINHAKSAGIPIIVAINKIDLPDANPQKVKEELMKYELVSEEWGGDTIFVEISAKKNINIDELLEMVLLQADVLELKANPTKQAKGVVIEARLDKNKGAIASLLVQRGKLDIGDTIVVGTSIGRIRSMINDKGKKVKTAGPSTPVEVMGLTEVPQAGDIFYEVKDEKMAKHLIERRKRQEREKSINNIQAVTLDNLFNQMETGKLKQLNLIVKADVQGSVEALKQSLEKLSNDEVKVKVIHAAAGAVTETDVTLAKVSNAIIIAFNVRPAGRAKETAERDEVQIKQYSVIYQALDDVEQAMKGLLDPKFEEEVIGTAEVRQTFKISNVGTIAGAMVLTGKLQRNAGVRVIREDVVIHEGKLSSLKRYKDDVKEVSKDFECGIQIEKYNDIKEGDIIEAFIMKEIKR